MWLAAPSGLRTRVVIDSPPRLGPVNVGGGRKPSAPPSRFPAECRSFPELHCPPRRPRSLGGTPVDRPLRRPGGLLYRRLPRVRVSIDGVIRVLSVPILARSRPRTLNVLATPEPE